ncbi:MAG: diguanylate cyclase [Eubacteriales bacterium]|nr:diguanylate cyclase [Eubacteriales bacterium]
MKRDFYKSALKEAPIGYAFHRIICDENGEAYDYEYIDVNSSFSDFAGLEERSLIGHRFSECFPQLFELRREWIQLLGDIAVNGGIKEAEQYSEFLERWYRIKIFSPEKYYFIVYVLDTSRENEQSDELKSLVEIFEETEFKYRSISEEKDIWDRRLHEIADVLKLENDLQFQRIIESLPFSVTIVSLDGMLLYGNTKCLALYEMEENFIGTSSRRFWADKEKLELWEQSLKSNNVVNDFEMHLQTTTGKELWAIGSGIIINYHDQEAILSTQIDITERKRIESALKISEEKYRLLTEFTSDVIWILNIKQKRFTYLSPSIYYLTGYTPEEAVQMSLENSITPESAMIVGEAIERDLHEFLENPGHPKSYRLEIRQNCKNGDIIWVEVSSKYRFNEEGDVEIVGVSRNIEERKKAEREVLYLSYHDQLTGLYNRRFYAEELQRMNFRHNLPITLVIADINGLKMTNDAFGHYAGDELLKKFTSILNKTLRPEDMAARIGGDEFVLLLPQTDSVSAERIVNQIKAGIRHSKSENAVLSVSFGWVVKEGIEDDFDLLFIQAEDNMYHTKLVESTDMKNETIRLAMRKLYQKNPAEQHHSKRVGKLCRAIGAAMGLTEGELLELELLGRMHDIGKIGVQGEILNKMTRLNETEWLEIKRHPEVGYQILRSADEYVQIAESVLSHHERMDGKGYPRSLKREDIPLQARILAVAEAYDVMRNGDLYKVPIGEAEARKELAAHSGIQFDSEIVAVFIERVLEKDG